uniref:Tripartite motif containing 35-12 n=1 Tax=Myripristis murdjan TaxID=586833 RepID=A0A667ZBE9_9TELE
MAEKIAVTESNLYCHVCAETFRDPVSLSCNHSFCSSCLKQFWEQTKNKNCPICKRKASKDYLHENFTLKELADSFAGRQKAASSETEKGEEEVEVVCREHKEEPKWFCKDEKIVVCHVCHHGHKVVPIEEAVSELKEKLKSDLKSLQDKRKKYEDAEKTYKDVVEHSKKQLVDTERQIRAEFNKLHQFLKEEEEARLAALREEEEHKRKTVTREMKMIEEKISSLSDSISAVEKDLQKHNVPFLSSYKSSQSSARAQCSQPDPQLVSGALIDVAKHLGNLSFRVWEKMRVKVNVRHGDATQQLPDNPERNTNYTTILGSEGFSSGKRMWEVEVGDHPHWTVGLAKETANRKGRRSATPENGIWCLWHGSGKYTNGFGETINLMTIPQRIRVQLDYDRGQLSFYDPEDMTLIYTYRERFTKKVYPFSKIQH